MAEKQNEIFEILNKANTKDVGFFTRLTEEQRKKIPLFVVQRWLSGTSNIQQVIFLNEVSNPYVFALQKHPVLVWQLLTICTSGKVSKCYWNKLPAKATTSKPTSVEVVSRYFNYSFKHAKDALLVLKYDDIILCAYELGVQDDELAKIDKEWGVKNGKRKSGKNKTEGSEGSRDEGSGNILANFFEE